MRTLILLIVLACALPSFAASERTISVAGKARLGVAPDLATFNVVISHQSMDPVQSQDEVEDLTTAMVTGIRALPLLEDSLQAAHLEVSPQYRWVNNHSKQVFDGYRVSRNLRFTLNDLGQLGRTYQEIIRLGATSVQPAVLSSTQASMLEQSLLTQAFENARQEAALIATAAGMTLGTPTQIHVSPVRHGGEHMLAAPMAAARMESDAAVYEPGQIEIQRDVAVTFELLTPE